VAGSVAALANAGLRCRCRIVACGALRPAARLRHHQ
jgi:hypothetical protein